MESEKGVHEGEQAAATSGMQATDSDHEGLPKPESGTIADLERKLTGVAAEDFKPSRRLYVAFMTLAVITLMVALDGTSLSVALPVSQQCLHKKSQHS